MNTGYPHRIMRMRPVWLKTTHLPCVLDSFQTKRYYDTK